MKYLSAVCSVFFTLKFVNFSLIYMKNLSVFNLLNYTGTFFVITIFSLSLFSLDIFSFIVQSVYVDIFSFIVQSCLR